MMGSAMEWRPVPGFPGYEINRKGRVRKSTGYQMVVRRGRVHLSRDGRQHSLKVMDVVGEVFGSKEPEASELKAVLVAYEAEIEELRAENVRLNRIVADQLAELDSYNAAGVW